MNLSALSTENIHVPVTAIIAGATYNPTSDTVQIAFPASGVAPASSDWHTAGWATVGTSYEAVILVGPAGSLTLPAGFYDVWVKVTASPEVPVAKAGVLTIS